MATIGVGMPSTIWKSKTCGSPRHCLRATILVPIHLATEAFVQQRVEDLPDLACRVDHGDQLTEGKGMKRRRLKTRPLLMAALGMGRLS